MLVNRVEARQRSGTITVVTIHTPHSVDAPVPLRGHPSHLRLTASQQKGWGRRRQTPRYIWRDGKQYFSISSLALNWNVSRGVATHWAKARPYLTVLWNERYLFCRDDEGAPTPGTHSSYVPDHITRDSVLYYSMPALARMRGTTPHTTRAWVRSHPHLAIRVGKHVYCRDEEFYGPRALPPMIERGGVTYWSIPELARRRGVDERATRRWVAKRLHLTVTEGAHLYARDAEYGHGKKASPIIVRDGFVYYSIAELATRRRVAHETARKWAARHPHLTRREGRYIFARDEEYHPRRPREVGIPGPPIFLKTLAARRHRRASN